MVNGKVFIQVEEFIKHKRGQDGLDKFLAEAEFFPSRILEEKEYPFEDYVKALNSVVKVFNDDQIPYKIGWSRAKTLLLAKGRKNYDLEILEKVAAAWGKFNNFGDVSIRHNETGSTSVLIANYESDPIYCLRMQGFFQGLCDIVEKDMCKVTELKCVNNGDEYCEFLVKTNACKVKF